MHIKSFVFNPFYENTYLIWDDTLEALIIDPGCYEPFELKELLEAIKVKGLSIKAIINTHCHIDHVLGNYNLKNEFNCPLWIPKDEAENYRAVSVYAPQWGIQRYSLAEPDLLLENSGTLRFGNSELEILYVPGHSPGHQVFYHKPTKQLIGGDVLFKGSIGRTDLPGGNHQQLIDNIREKLYLLPDDTRVFPGHGPSTTIGEEKTTNPFVKAI